MKLNLAVEVTPPRLPKGLPTTPRRDAGDRQVRIAALRVEFMPDTLETTSGDGKFDYGGSDTIYFDPPPHDAQYFSDQLEFLRYYWREMSGGALEMEWDIFPSGDRAAYPLPRQMWEYNWNYTPEQLDRGLAELFRDAVTTADVMSQIDWRAYDLVLVFHAGAGAEFTLGFDTTPHDIPSAWMVPEDFEEQLDLPGGVPVGEDGYRVPGGLILPETESRQGLQISMAGITCSLFGHWLGLPALYDNDDGRPVVGKWSLMDRGFGNFYGAVPGELDAWSRSFMGWLTPLKATPGDWSLAARGRGSGEPEAVKLGISNGEYYLLECRSRDPEGDSVAVAWDRDERRMVFHEDYTVDYDPGFRVPVRVDNLDFDSPGSGILIWHVDESLLQVPESVGFNSVDERRGLDLEEADGAQDIGRDYSILQPGYGADYGIADDAWFFGNEAHKAANRGREVAFGDDTNPDSRANSGAWTHIAVSNFSLVDTVMTFSFRQRGWLFPQPVRHGLDSKVFAVGNFDDDTNDDEVVIFGSEGLLLFDNDGSILDSLTYGRTLAFPSETAPLVRDLDGDGRDEVVLTARNDASRVLLVAMEGADGGYSLFVHDSLEPAYPGWGATLASLGGPPERPVLCLVQEMRYEADTIRSTARFYDTGLDLTSQVEFPGGLRSLHRFGGARSDSFLAVTIDCRVYLIHDDEAEALGGMFSDWNSGRFVIGEPVLADLDASGRQDLAVHWEQMGGEPDHQRITARALRVWWDVAFGAPADTDVVPHLGFYPGNGGWLPCDVDGDGGYELLAVSGSEVLALEANGVIADRFTWDLQQNGIAPPLLADLTGDGGLELLLTTRSRISVSLGGNMGMSIVPLTANLEVYSTDGTPAPRFPLTARFTGGDYRICQLDDDPGPELLIIGANELDAYDFTFATDRSPSVWWQGPFRDGDNSNAVWEPAVRFSPQVGAELLPKELCYNWPNPATGETRFRYFLNFPADEVRVKVFDITGEQVAELTGPGEAGMHHEIVWNLSGVPQGAYFARVEATGAAGSDSKLVKVAVVNR